MRLLYKPDKGRKLGELKRLSTRSEKKSIEIVLVRATESTSEQTESRAVMYARCGVVGPTIDPNAWTGIVLKHTAIKGDSPVREYARTKLVSRVPCIGICAGSLGEINL
jgi:hypothetical protein